MNRKWVIFGFVWLCLMTAIGLYQYSDLFFTLRDQDIYLIEDSSIAINLARLDSDWQKHDYRIEQLPDHGWLKGTLPVIIYQPKSDFYGEDRFSYSVGYGGWKRQTANIYLKIEGRNDPPRTTDTRLTVPEDGSIPFIMTASDPEENALTYRLLESPSHGTLSGTPPKLTYTPHANFHGEDQLRFMASDGDLQSLPGTIKITVVPRNDPPRATSTSFTTKRNTPVVIELSTTDAENDPLVVEWLTGPLHGQLKKEGKRIIYYPRKEYTGKDQIRYRVFDGQDYSAPAEVIIDIQPFSGAESLSGQLRQVIQRGGVAVGNDQTGRFVFRQGNYMPASILKMATALAAIHYLGEDAKFQTEFFLDEERNLYIKGYGDPSLTTTEWKEIAAELHRLGVFEKPIRRLVLDDTAIEKDSDFDGREKSIKYFDAPLGALATNYNTISVDIKSKNRILPWRNQTPVTASIRSRARGLPKGYQYFSVAVDSEHGTRYTGELAVEIFRQFGVTNKPDIQLGPVPASMEPLYIHNSSMDLAAVTRTMLYESSNFIANQLLLVMAIDRYGEQVRLGQGVKLLKQYLNRQMGIGDTDFDIVEGSGLSRKNRIGLSAMLDVVIRFEAFRHLLPPLTKSKYYDLVDIGRHWHILAKTGTMTGVATLAGFLQKKDGQWLPFVIMLEGEPSDRARVLEIICRFYAGS
ncbi:MAG: D-alanyl-D-alanine carboxypeptidase [bacterium]